MESRSRKFEEGPPDLPPPESCIWFGEVKPRGGSMVPAKIVRGVEGGIALILLRPGRKILPASRMDPVEMVSLRPLPATPVVRELVRQGVLV